MADDTSVSPRTGRALLHATIPFAEESRVGSWWCVGSTLAALVGVLTLAAVAPWWPWRLAASIVGGLMLVRAFILYHDFVHGSLLSGSRLARGLHYSLGLLMLILACFRANLWDTSTQRMVTYREAAASI